LQHVRIFTKLQGKKDIKSNQLFGFFVPMSERAIGEENSTLTTQKVDLE